jgi:biopolymer transport protein ExbD
MKLALFKENRLPSDSLDENDIDITPMMNMFIILVTFLVSMAVFTHIAIIDFTLPPNVGAGLDMSQGKPKVKITVRLGSDFLGIVLGDKLLDSLPVVKGDFPFKALAMQLAERRKTAAVQDEVVIASLDEIAFKQVVRVMDICRETGFARVGLSSATVTPEVARGK